MRLLRLFALIIVATYGGCDREAKDGVPHHKCQVVKGRKVCL